MLRTTSQSLWTLFPFYCVALSLTFVGFPFLLLVSLYQAIDILCLEYQFYEQTIVEKKGIFSVSYREVHYSRIKSIKVDRPFFLRLVGLSNITIQSSDPYMPLLKLHAVDNGLELKEFITKKAEKWRRINGVKEFDLYSL